MKAFVAASERKQQATINSSDDLLTLWWVEATECGDVPSKSTIIDDIFEVAEVVENGYESSGGSVGRKNSKSFTHT